MRTLRDAARCATLPALVTLSIVVAPLAHADDLVWHRVTEPSIVARPQPTLPSSHAAVAAALPSPSQVPLPAVIHVSAAGDRYAPLIAEVAGQYNIDPMLMHAVIHAESAYNEHALSDKGAVGLMQLMPATAERFGKTALYQPRDNLEAGAAYLQELLQHFGGRLSLALAGYNAGEEAVLRNGNTVPPYPETRAYVQRVLAYYDALKDGNAPVKPPASATAATTTTPSPPRSSRWQDLGKLGQLLMSSGTHPVQTDGNDTSNFQ